MPTYTGSLYGWYETGTEGVVWTLTKDGRFTQPYENMAIIEKGDRLKIFAPDNTVLFDDIIRCDTKTGWQEYPLNPGHGQPCALGYRIHWTQKGWTPDAWTALFMNHDPSLRAELTKKLPKKKKPKKNSKQTTKRK